MAVTPLNNINVTSSFALTGEVLGDLALGTLLAALKASTVTLTGCQVITQNAQLLIVTGTLADFVGPTKANVAVRLYLFEVPTIEAATERHALLLISDLPANYKVEDLWNAYATGGPSAVTKILSGSTFVDQMLLLSSLDYDDVSYIDPPFPPAQDNLPTAQQKFIAGFANQLSYVTRGFTYRVLTGLAGSTPVPGTSLTLAQVLGDLSAADICQEQPFLSQVKFDGAGANLVLFHQFGATRPKGHVQFTFEFESIGLAFPLGVTTSVWPQILLRGSITIGAKLEIEADFDIATRYLTIILKGFPSFDDFVSQFESGQFDMRNELGTSLPGGKFDGLGSITLEEIEVGIDFNGPAVDRVRFVVAAEKSLSLIGDLLDVQPSLSVQIFRPFDSAERLFDVNVYGRWIIEKAEIDTSLGVTSTGDYQITATLALGQDLNLSHLLDDLLGGQISGIPNLAVNEFEFIGIKNGADTYYEVELDLGAGWHLGDLPLTLDDVHLETAFSNGKLTEAELSATLEFSDVAFRLAAEYVPDNEGWMFSGGTLPGSQIHVGQFITALASELGVDSHNKFLETFEAIEITGLYVEYRTFKEQSSQMSLFLSLDTGGKFGDFLPLDKILVRFQTNGSGTMWRFDATADSKTDVSKLVGHINTYGVQVDLPESLTSLKLAELGGYYDSALGNYGFTAYATFGSASVYIQIDLKKQLDGKLEKDVSGQLVFNENTKEELAFELDLVSTSQSTDFVASYQATDATSASLASLVKAITGDDQKIPDGFSIDIRDAVFSHHKSGDVTKSIFAIDMDAGINLSSLGDLPLIGSELSAAKTLALAFQIIYASSSKAGDSYTIDELKNLNAALPASLTFKFPESAAISVGSPEVNVQLRLGGGESITMGLPVGLDKNTGQLTQGPAGPQPPNAIPTGADGITWFDIKQNFGPLNLSRIGFKLGTTGGVELTGYLDGGLSLMGLTVELLGLSVSTTLTGTNKFKPTFGLDGLGIDFKSGPLESGGSLYKLTDKDITEFDGLATIRTENLQLSAIGSFAELSSGDKSLFLYAVLDYPLGGPGFFFVTGLAAGFGYNRQLLIPPVDQLKQFPLIAEAMTSEPSPPTTDMSQMKDFISGKIKGMEAYLPPQVGEYFLAVGVRFTSFELLDSFALLTVQFGKHFEVDVVGISTMLVPPNVTETPIAEAQLLLRAAVIPDEGIVLIQAQLTNDSYIFSRDCHLTGGFAFASWLKGEHEGEFVISLGGYHPDFKVPAYYPQVPRVGFNWSISTELSVKGGGYYALVPHAIMAGGYLNALFQTSDLKAWFNMNANFLLMWKPFHYDAQLSIDIGAEVIIHFFGTHTIGIDASADLHLWGPEFGGHARVSVKVIGITFHFSIDFGASPAPPDPVAWDEFRTTFLPSNDKIVSLNVEGGLERTVKDQDGNDVFVINRQELSIVTSSVLPIKSLSGSFTHNSDAQFGVAPMNQSNVTSSDHQVKFSGSAAELSMEPVSKSIPSALWGQQMETQLNRPNSMFPAMTGVRLTPAKPSSPGPSETVPRNKLAYDTTPLPDGYRLSELQTFNVTNKNATWKDVENNILNASVAAARSTLLTGMGFDPGQFNCSQPFAEDTIYPPQFGEFEVNSSGR
jgi:hypothetical protein